MKGGEVCSSNMERDPRFALLLHILEPGDVAGLGGRQQKEPRLYSTELGMLLPGNQAGIFIDISFILLIKVTGGI